MALLTDMAVQHRDITSELWKAFIESQKDTISQQHEINTLRQDVAALQDQVQQLRQQQQHPQQPVEPSHQLVPTSQPVDHQDHPRAEESAQPLRKRARQWFDSPIASPAEEVDNE